MKMPVVFQCVLAALSLLACSAQMPESVPSAKTDSNGLVIEASFPDEGSRTDIAGGVSRWEAGDAITVFYGGKSYRYTTATGGETAAFTSENGIPSYDANQSLTAWYPEVSEEGQISLPAVRTVTFLSGAQTNAARSPLAGSANGLNGSGRLTLSFKNLCSVLEVRIDASSLTEQAQSLTLEPASPTGFEGYLAFEGSANPSTLALTPSSSSSSIRLDLPSTTNLKQAMTLKIPLGRFVSPAGLKLTLKTNAGSYEKTLFKNEGFSSYSVSGGKTVLKHVMKPLSAFAGAPKSLSVLGIGNSFTQDSMQYLYHLLKQAGVENVNISYLYIGGCSLQTHATHFQANNASYTYFTNTNGTWNKTTSYSPLTALDERSWDVITLQQSSGVSGMPDSYEPYLTQLLEVVRAHRPASRLAWHSTWAYQGNSTHSSFPNYNSDQMTMYNAILGAYRSKVLPHSEFTMLIPTGTAVQNLRTSYFGDNLTRDGYHMSYKVGRLLCAMTWARALTGCPMDALTWTPEDYSYTQADMLAIREAAATAVAAPFVVTPSSYPEGQPTPDLEDFLRARGYDASAYRVLTLPMTKFAYYNSTNSTYGSTLLTQENSTQSNLTQFVATRLFFKNQLPQGTLIILKEEGYQYRPEGWTALDAVNTTSTRPGNVTEQLVEVDAAWWSSWKYRGFNVAKNPRVELTESAAAECMAAFAILTPKKLAVSSDWASFLQSKGYNASSYQMLEPGYFKYSYYNSGNSTYKSTLYTEENSTVSNLKQFIATRIFTKAELPVGSLIVVRDANYKYRPEGWTALDAVNTSSTRPGNVSTTLVEVNAAWWGSWNYRAFNISKSAGGDMTESEVFSAADAFAIFVPKN